MQQNNNNVYPVIEISHDASVHFVILVEKKTVRVLDANVGDIMFAEQFAKVSSWIEMLHSHHSHHTAIVTLPHGLLVLGEA